MDIKTKIIKLVLLADRLSLGYPVDISEELRSSKILLSTVEKYAPDFEDRVLFLSWEYAYRKWVQENFTSTPPSFQEFQILCMTPETHYLYARAFNELAQKLPKKITLEYIEPVLKG